MSYYLFTQLKNKLLIKRDRRPFFEIEKENDFWSVQAKTKEQAYRKMQARIRQKEWEQMKTGSTVSASSEVKSVENKVKEVAIPLKIVQKQTEPELQAA